MVRQLVLTDGQATGFNEWSGNWFWKFEWDALRLVLNGDLYETHKKTIKKCSVFLKQVLRIKEVLEFFPFL